jgi:hypothetical protein
MRASAFPSLASATVLLLTTGGLAGSPRTSATAANDQELRAVESFADIVEPARRSAALFSEAGKVILSPRCINCHPATDRPLQGDASRPHQPQVHRGTEGRGVPGMQCTACHTSANYDAVGIPGNPNWHVAPASMAWEGRSLREICEQIKDPTRNGGRKLEAVVEHMRSDLLVGWAWAPGLGRQPAPGTQARFGALLEAWARSGAACPAP